MPQPFRLFAPPAAPSERVLLVPSGELSLALPIGLVREVLVAAAVTRQGASSTIGYQDVETAKTVPAVLGRRPCPLEFAGAFVLLRVETLVSGLLAIACTARPQLASVTEESWGPGQPLPPPWVGGEKSYRKDGIDYLVCRGIQPKLESR
ncbi:MAG: hypothetical protein HC918_02580 [Oscillatoriales cyanobacterium SM2_1_8]|nr:hypothetical protein [Oscillatoriales cyanobacterium SM2_1_8]